MFSHNGKISEKQMRRMLVLSVFASTVFVIPYLSARLFVKSIVPGMLIFFLFACIYVTYIYGISRYYEKRVHYEEKEEKAELSSNDQISWGLVAAAKNGGAAGRLLLLLQVFRQIVRLAFYVVLSIAILGEAQVPFMPGKGAGNAANLPVVLPLLLVAVYGANVTGKKAEKEGCFRGCLGIEKQGRIYEMIFWVLFIPFILVILFGLGEVDYSIFFPHLNMSFGRLLLCGYVLLMFLLPVENYLYLRPFLCVRQENSDYAEENNEKWQKGKYGGCRSFFAILLTVLIIIVLSLLLLGIYGINGAGEEEMVTISIMRYIRLPFGVLERFDMLMIWFFMTGCFVLICETLYFSGYLLSVLFPKAKRIYLLGAVTILVLIIVAFLPEYFIVLPVFLQYGAILDIPLSVILPLLGIALSGLKGGMQDGKM